MEEEIVIEQNSSPSDNQNAIDNGSSSSEHRFVRHACLLKIKTRKLMEAFEAANHELTKSLLTEVELDLEECELLDFNELKEDLEYDRVTTIISDSRESVKTINNALNFASSLQSSSLSQCTEKEDGDDVKIRLKPFFFSGDLKEWRSFWDRYRASVHSKKKIQTITKFTFLIQCLKGKALEQVKGLEVTEKNYEIAISRLRNRYDDPKKLIATYYEELNDVVQSEQAVTQRANFDTVQKILKNLESVGVQIDQDYLRTIIMGKFSRDTLRNTLRNIPRQADGSYTVNEFL